MISIALLMGMQFISLLVIAIGTLVIIEMNLLEERSKEEPC